jgi:glycosyltransferase involved in cell wall biosynthesis
MMTHEFPPHRGGIALYAAEMARAARRLGHPVEVWAPAILRGRDSAWPFAVRRLPLKGTHGLGCQWQSTRQLFAERRRLADAVLYLPEPGPMLALMLLQFLDVVRPGRLLLTVHGTEILRFRARPTLRRAAARLFASADRIGTVSNYTHRLLLDHFPDVAGKVVLTPGALREDFVVHTNPPFRPAERTRLVILTVARLHPRKGQLHLLETLASLPPTQRSRLEYWIVGAHSKENYDSRLRAAAAAADFPVKFLGDVPDEKLGEIYSAADIFAMTGVPHRNSVEGFGIVYLEAGAHGLPVLAHDIGGVSDAVTHDQTGLLVPPGDRAALGAALTRLLSDPDLRRRLGDGGHARARRHSWMDSATALFGSLVPAP